MQILRDLNYSAITATELADAIIQGGELPARPVIITFDDGYEDVFQYAYPIMQEMGFIGVLYVYVDQVGLNSFVDYEQIKIMAESGWEIGNHSMTHVDLTHHHPDLPYEVQESRIILEQAVGEKVETFAYPYGESDTIVTDFVKNSDYLAGMGLGLNWQHTMDSLFDLNRIEIRSDIDLPSFIQLLPWSD